MLKKLLIYSSLLALTTGSHASNPEQDESYLAKSQRLSQSEFYADAVDPDEILQGFFKIIADQHNDPQYSHNWGNPEWVKNHYEKDLYGFGNDLEAYYVRVMGGRKPPIVNQKYKDALQFKNSLLIQSSIHKNEAIEQDSLLFNSGLHSSTSHKILQDQQTQTNFSSVKSMMKLVHSIADNAVDKSILSHPQIYSSVMNRPQEEKKSSSINIRTSEIFNKKTIPIQNQPDKAREKTCCTLM